MRKAVRRGTERVLVVTRLTPRMEPGLHSMEACLHDQAA